MPLAKKAQAEGLWQPIPGYPNLEKTADLDAFKEQFPELAEKLDEEVTKKEKENEDFFKNKGKVRVDHTDGYTYQVSEFNNEYQVTRWKKGSGRKGGRYGGASYVHTRIEKTFLGELAGFDKLLKKQAADEKWEIHEVIKDAKGAIKQIFATLVKQYTPTATATTEEKKEESSDSEEESSE